MHHPAIRPETCAIKTLGGNTFVTRQGAEKYLRCMRGRRRFRSLPGKVLAAFRCPHCHLWHVGNRPVATR